VAARAPKRNQQEIIRGPVDWSTTQELVQAGKHVDVDWTGQLATPDGRRKFEEWHRRVVAEELLDRLSVSGDGT
jgi:hypothetical protein